MGCSTLSLPIRPVPTSPHARGWREHCGHSHYTLTAFRSFSSTPCCHHDGLHRCLHRMKIQHWWQPWLRTRMAPKAVGDRHTNIDSVLDLVFYPILFTFSERSSFTALSNSISALPAISVRDPARSLSRFCLSCFSTSFLLRLCIKFDEQLKFHKKHTRGSRIRYQAPITDDRFYHQDRNTLWL